ncbi:bifunctional adenosylcobinamide kinase/adenosylcobinamide-phosphate guanylyltransferase [Saccharospirillum mangrovi]|uniref:bifunctional adenosylcobinamide kinase/adenosylcobinamide-phosphate guanylyltransferase n=1 Tax=Saccharospirillum mangrovi TaxID=2161747 RepID=UPI000D33BBA4|nr:bifunctional adenosylcobinamide kinase/adenosylcobinamide-phosphate guanylyltransferase [Saccharospirillum mangrovi]
MTVHLILGGARSGKSRFAERCALAQSDPLIYLATARAGDAEMQARIAHHQAGRDVRFQTHECPLELASAVAEFDQSGVTVLVDCLTLWLSNWLTENPEGWPQQRQVFLQTMAHTKGQWLLVSNEVGQGIVPLGELSRRFVDEAGWLHQELAELANEVTWVVAGLAQRLKPTHAI